MLAAVSKNQSDAPGPEQGKATETISLANTQYEQRNTLTVERVPGHKGVAGSEATDAHARDATERRVPNGASRLAAERINASFSSRGA